MAFEEVLPAVHAALNAASPDEFGAMSRFVDLDGPLHYLDFGGPADGPLLVCVHGLGGSHVNWVAIGPKLAQTCRVLALDLAGHGRTPLAGRWDLNPRYCLKVLAMFRLVNPRSELRIAGGRELHLGSLQALGLYAANSIFVGDYLTTKGQAPEADYQMIRDLGFEVVRNPEACS